MLAALVGKKDNSKTQPPLATTKAPRRLDGTFSENDNLRTSGSDIVSELSDNPAVETATPSPPRNCWSRTRAAATLYPERVLPYIRYLYSKLRCCQRRQEKSAVRGLVEELKPKVA